MIVKQRLVPRDLPDLPLHQLSWFHKLYFHATHDTWFFLWARPTEASSLTSLGVRLAIRPPSYSVRNTSLASWTGEPRILIVGALANV